MPDSSEEKTEKATPKKRSDQRKEGNIFQSKEVIIAFSLIVTFVAFRLLFPLVKSSLTDAFDCRCRRSDSGDCSDEGTGFFQGH